jgi:gliding motility-associated lipoprotein GldH
MYKVFFVIRHHNAYHYKNIWLQVNMKAPGDSLVKQAMNLNLADDLNGWLGTGMDDIYDQRIPITPKPIKLHKGVYHFSVQHTMREDPLQNILSTGIRVEKVKP